jgi:hypothetical protein
VDEARTRRTRRIAGFTMAALVAAAAVISYNDGLFLIRYAGADGWVVFLYPLLPDGLIVISSASLFEAALTRVPRPRWAMAGLILGASLTVAMNVAAGAAVSQLLALADGFVPVVFFVALEILIGLIRRAQATPVPAATPRSVPAATPEPRQNPASERARANARARRLLTANPGMPLAQVAEKSGVSERTASRIKSGLPIPLRSRPVQGADVAAAAGPV